MNIEILEEIGLTKSEINVYLALLELGSSSTGKIVDKSKAASSKIYEILDKLMQKGLVSFIIKSGVKYFEAAPPERIMDYMKEKEDKFNKQKDELRKMLPELELKQKLSKYKSEAKIYKGMKGAETAFYDALKLLKPGEEMLVMGIPSRSETLNRFFIKFNSNRAKKKIRMKAIFNEAAREEPQTLPENRPLSEIKFIPETTPAAINIFGDRVLIFPESKEPLLISIDSKEVAESFRVQFKKWWGEKAQTYEGQETVEKLYDSIIELVKPTDDIVIFAAKPAAKRGADYNTRWNREIRKKVKNVRLLYYGDNQKNRERAKEIREQGCETKIIPTEQTNPISTVVASNIILNSVWGEKPTTFKIENKTVADSLKTNFELLWEQDTTVKKGFSALKGTFNEILNEFKPGETYKIIGAAFGTKGNEEKYAEFFRWFHPLRIKKGMKTQLLFQQGTAEIIKKGGEFYKKNAEIKFLPYKTESPVATLLSKDKTRLVIQEKEPTIITINNKKVTEAFQKNFDVLWNQEVLVGRGLKEVYNAWDAMLDELNPGEEYYVMGAADRKQKGIYDYLVDFHKRRRAKGVKSKFLFISGTEKYVEEYKDNYTLLSEVKYLPQGVYEGIQFNFFKNKILIIVWREKEPVVFTIEDKKVYRTFKTYFDTLWTQDVNTYKGPEEIKTTFQNLVDELNPGEEVHIMGVHDFGEEFLPLALFFQKIRSKKGIKAKFLMNKGAEKIAEKFKNYPPLEVKFMKEGIFTPAIFLIYNDKVIINLAKEKTFFVIKSKSTAQSFETYFQMMWKTTK